MAEDKLSRFVELMANQISDSDLELVHLGHSLGLDLVLFNDLRASQEESFADKVRTKSIEIMSHNHDNELHANDLFYAGSIDFMVSDEPGGKKFFLLEMNGGSNRGLSILTLKQQGIMYEGYYRAIEQALIDNKRGDNKLLILIGVPIEDGLIHEKVIMLDYLRKKLKEKNLIVKIYNIKNFTSDFDADIAFLIADYRELSVHLTYSDNWVSIEGDARVSVLIGDGIARRLHDDEFARLIWEDFRQIKTVIVNPIFRITDDKSLTYLASYYAKERLERYGLKYLLFTKAFNEKDLVEKIKHVLEHYKKPFIIKPNGGSGGAGVIPIGPREDPENIPDLIKQSKREFFEKFMKNRDPYPYTIQEMADFSLIDWCGGKHTFDLRIYMSQSEDGFITPIGGLARIARGSYKGTLNKICFIFWHFCYYHY